MSEMCWECRGCGWQVLDNEFEHGKSACLCPATVGADWHVSTVRQPAKLDGEPGWAVTVAGEEFWLDSAILDRIPQRKMTAFLTALLRSRAVGGDQKPVTAWGARKGTRVTGTSFWDESGKDSSDGK